MRSSPGYRLLAKAEKQRRPAGVAILATLGVLGSLLTILNALIQLISLMQAGVEPSRQLAVLGIELVIGLILLWINWGFWELIRWAWWANVVVALLSVAALIAAVRFIPELIAILTPLWRGDERQLASGLLVFLLVGIAYHLIALVYMFGVHAAFKVGVKDDRPLWERVHRN
jgi:hypothetical protein